MMKLLHAITLVSAMAMLVVDGISFSEMKDDTDLTSDEENRIYGGRDTNKYPYVAQLILDNMTSVCGGTLIAPQYVLTAVHCLVSGLQVYIGNLDSPDAELIRAVEAFRHPLYNSTWFTYDVALLKLEKPSIHKPARLVKTDESKIKPGTKATSIGWGMVNSEKFAHTLQALDVEIVSDNECSKYTIDTDVTLCAGTKRGKGICFGDVGGPLVVENKVVGIASALAGEDGVCGDLPDLYARIAPTLDFITNILNGGSTGNVTNSLPTTAAMLKEYQ